MSVVEVRDDAGRRGGFTSERKGPVLELFNRRYRRHLYVRTNDINDGPETVLAAGSVPQLGDTYSLGNDTDSIAQCIDVQAEPDPASPFVWRVTAQYDSSRTFDLAISNPLNLPAEVTWSYAKYDRPLQRDLNGVPMINSSDERFDPPMTAEDSRPILVVSRNESSFVVANTFVYKDAVNLDAFGPAAPGQAKMTNITGRKQVDIGITYWKVTYEVEFRPEGFWLYLLDQGFRDADGKLFRDPIDFSPLANPTLLNGDGFRQADTWCSLSANIDANTNVITVVNASEYGGGAPNPGGYFPPGPVAGTAGWYFEIKIGTEIMQVQAGFGTGTWIVQRGWAGTTPAAHVATASKQVYLQPVFLRFQPCKQVMFAPLNLPTS